MLENFPSKKIYFSIWTSSIERGDKVLFNEKIFKIEPAKVKENLIIWTRGILLAKQRLELWKKETKDKVEILKDPNNIWECIIA